MRSYFLSHIILFCITIIFSSKIYSNEIYKTKLYNINGNNYISALEYANSQNIYTIFYDDKEKLELRFQNYKLLISPYSSFIRLNEKLSPFSWFELNTGNQKPKKTI